MPPPPSASVERVDRPALAEALKEAAVLRAFVRVDGRLASIPTKLSKQLVVLNHIAQDFEIGRTYPEAEVSEMLARRHSDFAALRRYLVENEFLERREGLYWRAGGTVEVD